MDDEKDKVEATEKKEATEEKKEAEEKKETLFTQEEVNKMLSGREKQGRDALLGELGVDPKDEKAMGLVRTIFGAISGGNDSNEKDFAEEYQAAMVRADAAEAKLEGIKLGISPQYIDDAVSLARVRMADGETDFKTAIAELKPRYPLWFCADEEESDKKGDKLNKGTGSVISGRGGAEGTKGESLGARLAANKVRNAGKSSFFSRS